MPKSIFSNWYAKKLIFMLFVLTVTVFIYPEPKDEPQPLTVEISSQAAAITHQLPISITITFSRDVTGFSTSDLEIHNAELIEFMGGPRVYQCKLLPKGNYVVVLVIVPENICTDFSGDPNKASQPFEIRYSTINWLFNNNDSIEDLNNDNLTVIKDYFPWPGYTNRALFIFLALVDDNPIKINSFKYGDKNLRLLKDASLKVGNKYFLVAWYYLYEADLPSKSADIVLTCSQNIQCIKINSYLLKDVLQNSFGVCTSKEVANSRDNIQTLTDLTDGSWILAGVLATTEKLIFESGTGQAINRLNTQYGAGTVLKKLEDQAHFTEISFSFNGLADHILSLAVEVKHAPFK